MTDLSATSLHLPRAYRSRPAPEYFNDAPNLTGDVIYQPDVYALADYLVRTTGRRTVLDIGCGSARKLLAIEAQRRVGLDYADNIATCRAHSPSETWLELDLETGTLPAIPSFDARDAIVINSDVIEHLVNPLNLITILGRLHDEGAIVLVSTPDRIRSRGADHLGPPGNPAHVREWALDELVALMSERGLPAAFAGYTINHTRRPMKRTILTIHDRGLATALAQPARIKPPVAFVTSGPAARAQRQCLDDQGIEVRDAATGAAEALIASEPDRWQIELDDAQLPVTLWPHLTLAQSLAVIDAAGYGSIDHVLMPTTDDIPNGGPPSRIGVGPIDPSGTRWRRGRGLDRPRSPYAAPCFVYGGTVPTPALPREPSLWKRLRATGRKWRDGPGEAVDAKTFHQDFLVERLSDVGTVRTAFLSRLK